MSSIALCPGSYDPITLGHLDIARRVLTVADEVVIGVAENPGKKYLFPLERRVELARQSAAEMGIEVSVEPIEGLLAAYVKKRGITAIVKGLRGGADFESERAMALLNRHMSGVETLFIMGDQGLNHVSSSYVKEIASFGVELPGLVPDVVREALASVYEGDKP
ncbi:MAG TPA: pantetheine-phosphate adenylyltransferase [Actinomycetaceae bacterium]|nr:pantetheine-phosphate adenylyltransferase [Actinomycetaceae bacterium]